MKQLSVFSTVVATAALLLASSSMRGGVTAVDIPTLGINGDLNGMQVFPPDNPWNTRVDKQAVWDPMSDKIIARMGADKPLVPDFGSVAMESRVTAFPM